MRRLVLALLLLPSVALAQSAPDWKLDYVPGVQEWHDTWAGKADVGAVAGKADAASVAALAATVAAKADAAAMAAGLAQKQDVQPLAAYMAPGQTTTGLMTGAFDAAPAINAALAAKQSLTLPCGVYALNSPITGMSRDGTSLIGTPGCTVFNVGFPTGDVIPLSNTHFQTIRDLAFNATVARTSGAAVHQYQTANQHMDNLLYYGLWNADAMLLDGSNTVFINDPICSNGPLFQDSTFRSGSACIRITGNAIETHITHGLGSRFDKGLQVTHGSGVYAEGFSLVQNGNAVLVDPDASKQQSVFILQLGHVQGDTSYADNWLFTGTGPITDVQVDTSGASSSGTGSGVTITNPAVDGLHIANSILQGNYGDGLNWVAGKNISVTGGAAERNNITNATAGSGYHLHAGVSHGTIMGARAGDGGTYTTSTLANHQVAGIVVDPGPGDHLTFTGNNLSGNIAASMAISATGSDIKTSGNAGFTEAAGVATQLPAGQVSMTITTGINAPDSRIVFLFSPLTSYASCGITGLSSSFVSGNAVTMTASNAPTSPCQFYWRASAWGN